MVNRPPESLETDATRDKIKAEHKEDKIISFWMYIKGSFPPSGGRISGQD